VDRLDPPSWPPRRSKSSELEERLAHGPDPRFLCPTGDRPPQAVARTGGVAVAATSSSRIRTASASLWTSVCGRREPSGRQATDLQEQMYTLGQPQRRAPPLATLARMVHVGVSGWQRWPNRTFENIGAGDWSPLRPDPPDSLTWPLSPHIFDRGHHCLPVSRGESF
jgi:hypothetical protein